MPRLFIALPVDDSVTANLARVGSAAGVREARGVRWVAQENMHLTLAFLGDVEERSVPELEDVLFSAVEEYTTTLHLKAQGIGAFPNDEAARVLWAGLDGDVPRLIDLRGRLVDELRHAGFAIDPQRFRPHITLARLQWPQPVPPRLARLQEFGEWRADEVRLVESRLHASGARYVVRLDVPLDSDPA